MVSKKKTENVKLRAASQPAESVAPVRTETESHVVGEDGETLRVLNFTGGGFDTTMQLGVTHALLVSQGKAPDVVVGISAGAIEAAALAEILREGKLPEDATKLDTAGYDEMLGQRVGRFRRFANACHEAPESIVDAIVPDAYQIDSFEPLASLRLPRLSATEREERDDWIRRKTGLVRLYNDVLSIDLPFGAVTRLIRRFLGISAANSVGRWYKRWPIRIIEFLRLWLVAGSELRRLSPAFPILLRPLAVRSTYVSPSTAGSIIFKFRPIENFWNFLRYAWSFLFLLNFWLLLSWAFVAVPFILAGMATGPAADRYAYFWVFYVVYLLPIILPLTPVALAYDQSKLAPALRDLSKGLFAFVYYLLKWTVVLLAIYVVSVLAVAAVYGSFRSTLLASGELRSGEPTLMYWLIGIALVLVGARLVVIAVAATFSYQFTKRRHGTSFGQWYVGKFLDFYRLGPALAHNYNLKRLLVGLFDPGYYGKPNIETVLSKSLKDAETKGHEESAAPRTLSEYLDTGGGRAPKIVVAVAAADVGAGKLAVIDQDNSIVDSLLAATAITPVFSPVWLDSKLYIDGITIGNSPTRALVELFDSLGLADVNAVHIYAVDPLPISREELGPYAPVKGEPYINLIDIVMRALQLQRFRDAKLERSLTGVVSRVIPAGKGTVKVRINDNDRKFFRAFYAPIEPETAPYLNRKIAFSSKAERRTAISDTIAAGCRSALQVMHAGTLSKMATKRKYRKTAKKGFVRCNDLLAELKKQRAGMITCSKLPGSGPEGPGLAEICKHCRLMTAEGDAFHEKAQQSLHVTTDRKNDLVPELPPEIGDWPYELEPAVDRKFGTSEAAASSGSGASTPVTTPKTGQPPCISTLFSGGVFKGVFQLGVLNAFNLLNVKPRIVAGASVGSITAAMVLSALTEDDEDKRVRKVAKLASVYIGIDRIILTDRFASSVRNLTIRASETKFSLQQMDRVFRKYDVGGSRRFQRDFRQVMAGLERLFYINPYQVNHITRSIRNRVGSEARRQVKLSVQQWLDRMEVGEEVLGAEPIQMLIEEFVIPEDQRDRAMSAPFNCIDENTLFLATATNLTRGELEILSSTDDDGETTLIEGLLASSAFPGVFRPRRSWDLQPGSSEADQFIDGGVMDNLPLDDVLLRMRKMADRGDIPLRPDSAPHLMVAASLEVDSPKKEERALKRLNRYWPEMSSRAKELRYNIKLDTFDHVADNLQTMYRANPHAHAPLRVKVLAIKPRWLPKTFAFHPMLGFRRSNQTRSIAHGCAMTLLAFSKVREYCDAWGLNTVSVPQEQQLEKALDSVGYWHSRNIRRGRCWLQDQPCPFSQVELEKHEDSRFDKRMIRWLGKIHRDCWIRGTHIPE